MEPRGSCNLTKLHSSHFLEHHSFLDSPASRLPPPPSRHGKRSGSGKCRAQQGWDTAPLCQPDLLPALQLPPPQGWESAIALSSLTSCREHKWRSCSALSGSAELFNCTRADSGGVGLLNHRRSLRVSLTAGGIKTGAWKQGEVDGGDSAHGEREQRLLQEQHLVRGQIRLSQRMGAKGDLTPRSSRHSGLCCRGKGLGGSP